MIYVFWTAYINYLKIGIKIATTIKFKKEKSNKVCFSCHGYLMTPSQSAKIAKNNAWVNKPYFLDEKSYDNSLLILK